MTGVDILTIAMFLSLAAAVLIRLGLSFRVARDGRARFFMAGAGRFPGASGICQTTGSRELQADVALVEERGAGTMAVLADGIGKMNTGRVCAQIAADTILDRYEPYHVLHDPVYFFRTAFYEANKRIRATIGERRGGASVGAVFFDRTHLFYALAGDIRIALLRNGELIPLSRGQTLDILAVEAWENGKISRQDALFCMEEKRLWNYLGMDGFREIETCVRPVCLKEGDLVFLASKGITEVLSWSEIEDILVLPLFPGEQAQRIVRAAEAKKEAEKENGSVILLRVRTEDADAENQF